MIAARPVTLSAGDWPQILGPHRNGVADDETIRHDWGQDSPTLLWEHQVGQGYAGVAVAGSDAVVFHRVGNEEVVELLDLASGKQRWSHRWPIRYSGRIDPDTGPRCVPIVDNDIVLLHGVRGRLVCLSRNDGKPRWFRETAADFQVPEAYFGVGSSPLVLDDRVIVNVGGRDGAGVVAFARQSGKTLWQASDARASYASPVTCEISGRNIVLVTSWLEFLALDPATGEVFFTIPFGRRGPTVTAANPVVVADQHVFLSASYTIGAKLIHIEPAAQGLRGEVVYATGDLMSSQYATSVPGPGGLLFGIDGREDAGTCRLRCFDPISRKIYWSKDDFPPATLIRAAEVLLAMTTDGQLLLIKASPDEYRELARLSLAPSTTRALPCLSGGKLIVRDKNRVRCFDLLGG